MKDSTGMGENAKYMLNRWGDFDHGVVRWLLGLCSLVLTYFTFFLFFYSGRVDPELQLMGFAVLLGVLFASWTSFSLIGILHPSIVLISKDKVDFLYEFGKYKSFERKGIDNIEIKIPWSTVVSKGEEYKVDRFALTIYYHNKKFRLGTISKDIKDLLENELNEG